MPRPELRLVAADADATGPWGLYHVDSGSWLAAEDGWPHAFRDKDAAARAARTVSLQLYARTNAPAIVEARGLPPGSLGGHNFTAPTLTIVGAG
jgi:hypothetical protein